MQDDGLVERAVPMEAPILLALAALSVSTAQAAEPTTLTLACSGTQTGYETTKSMELSFNLFLDFTARTVESSGPSPFMNIGKMTQATTPFIVYLKYTGIIRGKLGESIGTLDRMTGDLEGDARTYKSDAVSSGIDGGYRFSVKCKPTQRMF
jgi:hypothetical protein